MLYLYLISSLAFNMIMAEQSTLNFKIQITEEFLKSKFEEVLDDSFENQKYEVNGVQMYLHRYDSVRLNLNRNSIAVDLPLDVKLIRPSGIFSVEAKGKIKLSLKVDISIQKNNEFTTKTKIEGFYWEEEPKFLIGSLDIPVESLVNMIINHYDSIISSKIDMALSESIDLPGLLTSTIKNINELALNFDWFGIKYKPSVYDVVFSDIYHHEGSVRIEGKTFLDIEVSDAYIESSYIPQMSFIVENDECESVLKVGTDIHFKILDDIIVANMEGEDVGGKKVKIEKINTFYENDKLNTDIYLKEPISALFKVSGTPLFRDDAQLMELENIHVEMHSSNILYKLTAPIVNKLIENQINKLFPLDIKSYLDAGIQNVIEITNEKFDNTIALDYQDAKLTDIILFENKVSAVIIVGEASAALKLK